MAAINRRSALRVLGSIGAGALIHPAAAQQLPRYSILGSGPVVLAFDRGPAGYFEEIARRYRVVVIQYPPQDPSQAFIDSFTVDRVCNDILAAADQAGAERFDWYGFSWGGVVGLKLATRTSRLTALACGGWPPLGGQYRETLATTEATAARGGNRLYLNFYRSIQDWPEREAVAKLRAPRLVFAGGRDQFVAEGQNIRIGALVAEHRMQLENMGWMVRLVPDFGHELGGRPDVVTPILREFLDPLLLHG
jgi:pimeloyl-ACP methyl ester carboxylesterase